MDHPPATDVNGNGNGNGNGHGNGNGQRLLGWKAVGRYLGCTERSARRWESTRGLPVHRLPGAGRASVWARPDEIAAWLKALPEDVQVALRVEAEAAAEPTAPASRSRFAGPAVVVFLGLLVVALAAWQVDRFRAAARPQPIRTPYDDDAAARDAYLTARVEFATRSADSLAAAEAGFRQLVARYPDRAPGWADLAATYILEREFSAMRDEVAFPQAARAAHTAIALDPKLADAWIDEGFIAWWWRGDAAGSFRAFETAIGLSPG